MWDGMAKQSGNLGSVKLRLPMVLAKQECGQIGLALVLAIGLGFSTWRGDNY